MMKSKFRNVTALWLIGASALANFAGCSDSGRRPPTPIPMPVPTLGLETPARARTPEPHCPRPMPADGGANDDPKGAGKPLTVRIVHASADLGPVRLCVWNSATRFAALETPIPARQRAVCFSAPADHSTSGGHARGFSESRHRDLQHSGRHGRDEDMLGAHSPRCRRNEPTARAGNGRHSQSGRSAGPANTCVQCWQSTSDRHSRCKADEGADASAKRKCGAGYDGTRTYGST